jgi:phage tail sheath protein FI
MPEYLAPGVYVEEIDTGSKPIEGVSTSTAGMVGVTERGPVNVPMLVTSYGEYVRWFGETLNPLDFPGHCFLPHAVDGFFTNGGKRAYVVRVLNTMKATPAATKLFDRSATTATPVATRLLAGVRTTPAASSIYVANNTGLGVTPAPTWIQIGDGSTAEFRTITAPTSGLVANDIAVRLPLSFNHAPSVNVDHFASPVSSTVPATIAALPLLAVATKPGETIIKIQILPTVSITPETVIRLGTTASNDDEYVITKDGVLATGTGTVLREVSLELRTPVALAHPVGKIEPLTLPAAVPANTIPLSGAAVKGDSVLFVNDRTGFQTAGECVRISDGIHTEIRRIGQLCSFALVTPAYSDYPSGSLVEAVTLVNGPAKNLTADAVTGSNVIEIDDRTNLSIGDVIQIGTSSDPLREYAVITGPPDLQATPKGKVWLAAPLQRGKTLTTPATPNVYRVNTITRATPCPTALVLATSRNSATLIAGDKNGYTVPPAGVVLRVSVSETEVYYHLITTNPAALTAGPLTLDSSLNLPHLSGEPIVARQPLLTVQALDAGAWGNRLRVAISDNDPSLVKTKIRKILDGTHLRLASANGVESGTVLQRVDANGIVLSMHKVVSLDRQSDFLITLDLATPLVAAVEGDMIRSSEFKLDVFLMGQPDAAVPSRSEMVLATESFPYLSLDPRHSNYVHKVIGTTWSSTPGTTNDDDGNPLRKSDRRSEGSSWFIRVYDEETIAANKLKVRLGPPPLTDALPSGAIRPARMRLNQGADAVDAISDGTYIGASSTEPEQRTGLFALQNEENISIIACPGQTSAQLQGALISHCEEMRYRFAVLDGPRPPKDSLNDAQSLRQNFDSKYAGFYHPWLVIPHPYPDNIVKIPDYPIPPSGHMLGIYARTDIERGVHKAPANEVVRGIIGLQRRLNKGEHDILNPYPVNINVIRDFRPNNRGIRVYGGRVITSDPDWKYVNVRRLLIYLEHSIDRGVQWVVFEPNADPLWARVRRTISNFLTTVWRNGALEGTTKEEAFFVKCDRTTMTQADIDNGKLICVIGVAPVKPAEFVIIRIGLWTAHAED